MGKKPKNKWGKFLKIVEKFKNWGKKPPKNGGKKLGKTKKKINEKKPKN